MSETEELKDSTGNPEAPVPDPRPQKPRPGLWRLIFVLAILTGLLLRFSAAHDEFWFDEAWSWQFALSLHSPLPIFVGPSLDNNHSLNTLWIYLLGDQMNWVWYRLPAVLLGGLMVVLAGWWVRRRGWMAASIAALVVALSYILVYYSSEARGYAPALFFALAALIFFEYARKTTRALPAFWAAVILGFLSHLEYAQFYLALLMWSAWLAWKQNRNPAIALRRWLSWNGVPLLFLLFLYWFRVRSLIIGGGPEYTPWKIVCSAASLVLGVRGNGVVIIIAAALCAGLVVASILAMWRTDPDRALWYGLAILCAPLIIWILMPPGILYERYFLLPLLFCQLLLAETATAMIQSSSWKRSLALLAFAAWILANAYQVQDLLIYGRGHYLEPIRYLIEHTSGNTVTVGADQDTRCEVLLQFYSRYVKSSRAILYVRGDKWPPQGPEWLLVDPEIQGNHLSTILRTSKLVYTRVGIYPSHGLSMWTWYLYHRETSTTPTTPTLDLSRRRNGNIDGH